MVYRLSCPTIEMWLGRGLPLDPHVKGVLISVLQRVTSGDLSLGESPTIGRVLYVEIVDVSVVHLCTLVL